MSPQHEHQPGPSDHRAGAAASKAPDPKAPIPPLRIVALDDDADFRQYLLSLLNSPSACVTPPGMHDVRTCATPEELLAACTEQLPDVVLLDMKMGRASGEDVLVELRKRWPRLCVIVITGFPSMDSMRQTFQQNVFDYLAKPFSIADLNNSLRSAVAKLGLGQRPQDRLRIELGRQLRLARTERDWTLKELSEASGISISQLSSIERGAHLPSLESLVDIARALEKQPSAWLIAAGL
jgi:CheY-like chemotaxis protein